MEPGSRTGADSLASWALLSLSLTTTQRHAYHWSSRQPPTSMRRHPVAGFTKRSESPYDPFGAGHSSTSISAALGMAVGRDVKGRKNNVVAVSAGGGPCSHAPSPLAPARLLLVGWL